MGILRAVALGLMLLPAVAIAQPKQPTPQQVQQAGDLVKKAIAKSQAGDHVLAIELYQQAYNIAPVPLLLSNIGAEYQQIQKLPEALKYFCKYLDADPTGSNAGYASAQAKSLQIQLGNQVDDKDVCKPKTATTTTTTNTGTGTGSGSGSGSSGTVTGTTDLGNPNPGTQVDTPPRKGRTLLYAGIGVGAAGVIGLVIGIDFGMKAKSLNDQINSHKASDPWPDQIDGVAIGNWDSQGHSWNVDTAVFSILGGVAIVAGGAMAFIGHNQGNEHAEQTAIIPTANRDGAGVAVLGRF
jgi:tetratricopeptide (TPR) repeat protein